MASVYILYSKSLDRFYIGSCKNLKQRLKQHKDNVFQGSYTGRAKDWETFLEIRDLGYSQARKIERHIKSMKSRLYIENLSKYPEMVTKLTEDYV